MFVSVRILDIPLTPLWYKVPPDWPVEGLHGAILRVPVQGREMLAMVECISKQTPEGKFKIRSAIARECLPSDIHYLSFLDRVSKYYHIFPTTILKRIKQCINQASIDYVPPNIHEIIGETKQLTHQQENVVNTISIYLEPLIHKSILLHGVTGSGKTEVYKALIEKVLKQEKSIIFLVPEVTLAVEFQAIFSASFNQFTFGFHSASGAREKKKLITSLSSKLPCIIIGVHLPVLLPIHNLGLIIVDEEHEVGYQEKKHPRLNSKEVALIKAQTYNIPILLGSATPSLASLYNVEHRNWLKCELTERYAGNFPSIKIISLKNYKQRKEFWVSDQLLQALKDRLNKKEQSILFLNRRGHSFFVQCKYCSFVFECISCAVSLTLHEPNRLLCHYCSYESFFRDMCQSCKRTDSFIKKGIGTQQVVSILKKLLPNARVARADLDTTVNRKNWKKILQDMNEGLVDILVGTQTITKGYDFKRLTLVGILWADLNLHFPMYNASETTLQQLLQVAGRAGRHHPESQVIVQTMTDHPIFSYLSEQQYTDFYRYELGNRVACNYPPIVRLIEIELRHKKQEVVEYEAHLIASDMSHIIQERKLDIKILGPSNPPVHKIMKIFRKQLYLKASSYATLHEIMSLIPKDGFKSEILFHPNPL